MKKFLCLFLAIVCALCCLTSTSVYAAPVSPSTEYDTLSSGDNDYAISYSTLTNYTNVTEYGYINNWNNFQQYYTDDFTEYSTESNCGPTQVANLLSYYKSVGYIYAFTGNTITQSYYTNVICPAVGFTGSAITLNDAANGFKTLFENGAEYYSVTLSNHLSLSWSNFKSLINNNKPLMLDAYDHLYLVIGYQIRDNIKYYVCLSGYSKVASRYALIEFSTLDSNRKSITIN